MSADPVTMFAITAVKTLSDIKASKKQSKIEAQRYEERKKLAIRQAADEEAARKREYYATIASNKASQAGSGFTLDSRSFLTIQSDITKTMEKDIGTIRLNLETDLGELGFAQDLAKSKRKQEQFGGWVSIASAGYEYKAKKDKYGS